MIGNNKDIIPGRFVLLVMLLLAVVTACNSSPRHIKATTENADPQRARAAQVVKSLDEQFDSGEAITSSSLELYCSYLHRAHADRNSNRESAIAYHKRLADLRDQMLRTYDGDKGLVSIIDYYASIATPSPTE